MSMYTELQDNNLMKDFLEPNDDKYILVMYGRGNCGNCKKLKPRFEARGDGSLGDDILFIYSDVDKYRENIFVDDLDHVRFTIKSTMSIDEQNAYYNFKKLNKKIINKN